MPAKRKPKAKPKRSQRLRAMLGLPGQLVNKRLQVWFQFESVVWRI